jgi:paraquat-inducible protein B
MIETTGMLPNARVRPRGGFAWIWIVPSLAERGPLITIAFSDAEGLEPGETRIRHKDVELGTVESIRLSADMSRVIVRARMRRAASPHLAANTRFWIVRPRVSVGGVSGLSTLVSGSYIEMYPGDGKPQRDFVGLPEPTWDH